MAYNVNWKPLGFQGWFSLKIRNVIRVIQWGYGVGSKEIPMYITAVPAVQLAERAFIFRRTPHRPEGYQRQLTSQRLGKGKFGVAGYLLKQMGLFPTSILVNIRLNGGEVTFQNTHELGERIDVGDLIIPDNLRWYVIDGQHRIEGLKMAMRDRPALEDYPAIVTITNESIFHEMLIFYIVNGRAKSVPTDLAYRIFQRMLSDKEAPAWVHNILMTGNERRKGVSATIVDLLNSMDHSPFKGRIREVGEIQTPLHITTDGTMTRYISFILREETFAMQNDFDLADTLASYWGALQELYPNAFKNPERYMLLSTLGISSLTRLFPTIYSYCAKEGKVSQSGFRKYLGYLLWRTEGHSDTEYRNSINERWWHKFTGPGLIRGTGEGHYSEVARKLAEKIEIIVRHKSQQ